MTQKTSNVRTFAELIIEYMEQQAYKISRNKGEKFLAKSDRRYRFSEKFVYPTTIIAGDKLNAFSKSRGLLN